MPTITFTLPVAGTDADAGPIATNFTNLQTLLNGGLDNANITTNAAIAVTKLAAAPAAHVYHNVAQAISTASWTSLAFNNERFDTDTIHDNATNNSRLTCKTAGKYLITGGAAFAPNAGGSYRLIALWLNGGTFLGVQQMGPVNGSDIAYGTVSTVWDLVVNDFVELQVNQNSGGSLNINSTAAISPEFSMVRLSA